MGRGREVRGEMRRRGEERRRREVRRRVEERRRREVRMMEPEGSERYGGEGKSEEVSGGGRYMEWKR